MSCDQDYSDFTGWDFEDGLIGSWTEMYENANYQWDIKSALNSAYGNYKVQHDHTTMTMHGKMAEVTSKNQNQKAPNGAKAILKSAKVTSSNGKTSFYCLTFWFWKRTGSDQLEIAQQNDQNNGEV